MISRSGQDHVTIVFLSWSRDSCNCDRKERSRRETTFSEFRRVLKLAPHELFTSGVWLLGRDQLFGLLVASKLDEVKQSGLSLRFFPGVIVKTLFKHEVMRFVSKSRLLQPPKSRLRQDLWTCSSVPWTHPRPSASP